MWTSNVTVGRHNNFLEMIKMFCMCCKTLIACCPIILVINSAIAIIWHVCFIIKIEYIFYCRCFAMFWNKTTIPPNPSKPSPTPNNFFFFFGHEISSSWRSPTLFALKPLLECKQYKYCANLQISRLPATNALAHNNGILLHAMIFLREGG